MEKKLVLRGLLAGAVAGLLAFVFARVFGEPQIQAAIDYESGRDAAQAALYTSRGLTVGAEGPDIFSRTVQSSIGIGVGIVGFGAAMGALFSVVYTVCIGRVGRLRARSLSMLLAGAGFLGFFLVPFLKYPANPPAVGHADTIRTRGELFLVMVVASVAMLVVVTVLGQRLRARLGSWNATLVSVAVYAVVMGVLMAVLPSLGHLAANVREFGDHATETPLPLTDAQGAVVYPGFPADTLWLFRFYSVGAQLVLWTALGLVFAPLAQRLLEPETVTPRSRDLTAA